MSSAGRRKGRKSREGGEDRRMGQGRRKKGMGESGPPWTLRGTLHSAGFFYVLNSKYFALCLLFFLVRPIQRTTCLWTDVWHPVVRPPGGFWKREDSGTLHSQHSPRVFVLLQVRVGHFQNIFLWISQSTSLIYLWCLGHFFGKQGNMTGSLLKSGEKCSEHLWNENINKIVKE